jgi:molybdate transport system substrate-binding protein
MSRLFSIAFERVHTVLRGAALLGIIALPACTERSNEPLLVAAAASLSGAMPDLTAAFEAETGYRVQMTTGASGQLAQQIREGAPIDVFLSADREWVFRMTDASCQARSRFTRAGVSSYSNRQHHRCI